MVTAANTHHQCLKLATPSATTTAPIPSCPPGLISDPIYQTGAQLKHQTTNPGPYFATSRHPQLHKRPTLLLVSTIAVRCPNHANPSPHSLPAELSTIPQRQRLYHLAPSPRHPGPSLTTPLMTPTPHRPLPELTTTPWRNQLCNLVPSVTPP